MAPESGHHSLLSKEPVLKMKNYTGVHGVQNTIKLKIGGIHI